MGLLSDDGGWDETPRSRVRVVLEMEKNFARGRLYL